MNFYHQHNLVQPDSASKVRTFGIRVTLPANDTLRKVVGDDWECVHWFTSAAERDEAYEAMALRHGYYRHTDSPTQVLEKVSR